MKVAIVIPAHNEEKRIAKTLESYLSFFNTTLKKEKLDFEVLVVVNASSDKTLEIVKKFHKKSKKIKFLNLKRGGKGYAVIEGFRYFIKEKNDLVGFVDADMATSPSAFHDLIKNIGDSDMIMASRYLPGSVVQPKQSIQRIFVSRIFNYLVRALFMMPYRDSQCGAKLLKSSALKRILPHLTMSEWAFDVELIYIARKIKCKVIEYPTVWSDKEYSKINFLKSGPFMALGVVRLRMLNSPFKIFMDIYDKYDRKVRGKNEQA